VRICNWNELSDFDIELDPEAEFYVILNEEIKMIVRNSAKFKVESATTVKLNKEVYPFRILQNYQEYY